MANNNQDRIDLLRKVYSKSEYTKSILIAIYSLIVNPCFYYQYQQS